MGIEPDWAARSRIAREGGPHPEMAGPRVGPGETGEPVRMEAGGPGQAPDPSRTPRELPASAPTVIEGFIMRQQLQEQEGEQSRGRPQARAIPSSFRTTSAQGRQQSTAADMDSRPGGPLGTSIPSSTGTGPGTGGPRPALPKLALSSIRVGGGSQSNRYDALGTSDQDYMDGDEDDSEDDTTRTHPQQQQDRRNQQPPLARMRISHSATAALLAGTLVTGHLGRAQGTTPEGSCHDYTGDMSNWWQTCLLILCTTVAIMGLRYWHWPGHGRHQVPEAVRTALRPEEEQLPQLPIPLLHGIDEWSGTHGWPSHPLRETCRTLWIISRKWTTLPLIRILSGYLLRGHPIHPTSEEGYPRKHNALQALAAALGNYQRSSSQYA